MWLLTAPPQASKPMQIAAVTPPKLQPLQWYVTHLVGSCWTVGSPCSSLWRCWAPAPTLAACLQKGAAAPVALAPEACLLQLVHQTMPACGHLRSGAGRELSKTTNRNELLQWHKYLYKEMAR